MDKSDMKKVNKTELTSIKANTHNLFNSICSIVDKSKEAVAIAVNQQLTMLYWQIGNVIRHDILKSKREDYGKLLELDDNENIYVSGITNYTSNGEIATVKYNSSGVQQWARLTQVRVDI